MAEHQFSLQYDGQALEQADVNLLGETSGLADDRVYAELFRMTPFDGSNVAKGILPSALPVGGGNTRSANPSQRVGNGTVQSNDTTGTIRVKPVRVLIGSRTAVATDARENWRDIRSGLSVADGATTTDTILTPVANATGAHRIDAVVARVDIDANSGTPKLVKMKSPTSGVVSTVSVYPYKLTNVTIELVTGTGHVIPTLPPDVPGVTYYVLLAYLDVPNGVTLSTWEFSDHDIKFAGNVLGLSHAAGGNITRPANCHNKLYLTNTIGAGGFPVASPAGFLPTEMQGGDSIFFDSAFAVSGVIDDGDWRSRLCRWTAVVDDSAKPAWDVFGGASNLAPSGSQAPGYNATKFQVGMGQTFREDPGSGTVGGFAVGSGSNHAVIAWLDFTAFHPTYTGLVVVYCDLADHGKIKVYTNGSVPSGLVFWVDFTAPFENYLLANA